MSKIIRFTPEIIDRVKAEFDERIKSARLFGGSFSYSKTFDATGEKATLRFTELAMLKMTMLVSTEEKEVAWHCVAEREAGNSYLISDILVYPQKVGATSVDMDVEEYGKWKMKGIMSGDERFQHLFAPGPSHVNMAVNPSPTDIDHQKEILDMVRDDGFYIFMIWNKRDERNIWIYDMAKNVMFENSDITVEVIEEENGVIKFLRESKPMVKAYIPPYSGGYYGSGYSGYNAKAGIVSSKPAAVKPAPAAVVTSAKPAAHEKPKVRAAVVHGSSYDVEDEDDPTSPFFVRDDYYGLE